MRRIGEGKCVGLYSPRAALCKLCWARGSCETVVRVREAGGSRRLWEPRLPTRWESMWETFRTAFRGPGKTQEGSRKAGLAEVLREAVRGPGAGEGVVERAGAGRPRRGLGEFLREAVRGPEKGGGGTEDAERRKTGVS